MSRDPAVFHAYDGCGVSAQHRRPHALRGAVKVFLRFLGLHGKIWHQRCTTAIEGLEIDRFLRRGALLPTPKEETAPLEGQGTHGGLVCLARGALLQIINLGPEGMPRGFRRPLSKRLAQARRTLQAPVPPSLRATAFRHWRNARIFLECFR
jgi:hypothetical protein